MKQRVKTKSRERRAKVKINSFACCFSAPACYFSPGSKKQKSEECRSRDKYWLNSESRMLYLK